MNQFTYIDLSGTGTWKKEAQQLLQITPHYKQFYVKVPDKYNLGQQRKASVCLSPPPLPYVCLFCFKAEAVRKNSVHFQFLTSGKSSSAAFIIKGLEGSSTWKTRLLGATPTDTIPV